MTDFDAMCFVAEKGLRPFGNQSDGQNKSCIWTKGWFNRECPDEIPPFLFDALKGGVLERCGDYRYYPTHRDAYLDLCQAIVATMSIASLKIATAVDLHHEVPTVGQMERQGKKRKVKASNASNGSKATKGRK